MPWVAGYAGSVFAGGISLSATSWTVDWQSDIIDVSNFNGVGWGAYIDGVPDYSFRVDAFWDTLEDPFGVLELHPGKFVAMVLYVNVDDLTARFAFPQALITDVSNEEAVRDTVRYSIVGKASAYAQAAAVKVPGEA